jgi:hypothetical protein
MPCVPQPVVRWVPSPSFYGAVIARILLSHYLFGCCLLRPALLAAAVHELRLIASTPLGFGKPVFVPVRPWFTSSTSPS